MMSKHLAGPQNGRDTAFRSPSFLFGCNSSANGLDHWKPAYRLFVHGAGAAPLTLQAYAGLSKDGQLDVEAFEHIAPSRHAARRDRTALRWGGGLALRESHASSSRNGTVALVPACFLRREP